MNASIEITENGDILSALGVLADRGTLSSDSGDLCISEIVEDQEDIKINITNSNVNIKNSIRNWFISSPGSGDLNIHTEDQPGGASQLAVGSSNNATDGDIMLSGALRSK